MNRTLRTSHRELVLRRAPAKVASLVLGELRRGERLGRALRRLERIWGASPRARAAATAVIGVADEVTRRWRARVLP